MQASKLSSIFRSYAYSHPSDSQEDQVLHRFAVRRPGSTELAEFSLTVRRLGTHECLLIANVVCGFAEEPMGIAEGICRVELDPNGADVWLYVKSSSTETACQCQEAWMSI